MGDAQEREPSLPTLNFAAAAAAAAAATMHSPDHPSGMATPPLHTLASVPFKWEKEPGKPIPCTDVIALPEPTKICLELPPSRTANKINPKTPSPTTVLDGPYNVGRSKFSSFRLFREAHVSFDSSGGGDSPRSAVDVLLGKKTGRRKTRWFFGRTRRFKNGKKEVDEGSFLFSTFSTTGSHSDEKSTTEKMEGKVTRKGSFSSFSQASSSHLWATICGSLKRAIPWKSARKTKQERLATCELGVAASSVKL